MSETEFSGSDGMLESEPEAEGALSDVGSSEVAAPEVSDHPMDEGHDVEQSDRGRSSTADRESANTTSGDSDDPIDAFSRPTVRTQEEDESDDVRQSFSKQPRAVKRVIEAQIDPQPVVQKRHSKRLVNKPAQPSYKPVAYYSDEEMIISQRPSKRKARQQPTPPRSRSRSLSTQPDDYAGEIVWTRRKLREASRSQPPPYNRSIDLPSSTQNIMNNLPPSYRLHDSARVMYEAHIQQQTLLDEPNAPKIEFWNNIDDQEPCPPWEFHYTNQIWHGKDVEPPEHKNLEGCNCHGSCNENSKTCICIKKQLKHNEECEGFQYDSHGRVKGSIGYPIFECNRFCGCDDGCQNRASSKILHFYIDLISA